MLQDNMSRVEQIRRKHKKRMAKIEEVRRAANRKAAEIMRNFGKPRQVKSIRHIP